MRKITFFKTMLLVVMLLAGSVSATAQLLDENFNYTPGTLLTANGWTAHSGAGTNSPAVIASSITYPGYASSGVGGETGLTTTGEDINRTFAQQTAGTIYFSFLVNISSASTTGDYFFHIGATTISTVFKGRVFVKKDASDNIQFGISQSTTTVNYVPVNYAMNTTYLVVLKYDIVTGTTNDVASIYINPTLNAAIPTTGWTQNTDAAGTDLANVGSIALRQGSTTPVSRVDGIRVSTLWSDIVGLPGSACTPSNLAFAAPTTVEKTMGDAAFTKTATSLNETTAITYTSNNTAVATVNASTGEVTLVGAGTAKITASQAAGTHNAVDYCAASAEYTINVAAADPTITVTEITVPAFSAQVGSTDTETINIVGANLTANIILTIEGTNASMFTVNSPLPSTGGVATITYTPTAPGSHTATLKINSTGAPEVTRDLNGTSTFLPPVATDASGISSSGFTANWTAVSGATGYELNVYTKTIQTINATDLFISEYIEGSSFNKAIEIYNGTGVAVNLSAYSLRKQVNGAGAYSGDFALTGTLANNAVHIVAHSSASAAILALANQTTGGSPLDFNGNDAVGLFKNGVQIDEVGVLDQVANWGIDVTLVRKNSISAPKVPYTAADWDAYAVDNISNLGAHTMTGAGVAATPIAGSPFTVTGDLFKTLSGLSPETTYYYTVVAKLGSFSSAASNEMSATTSIGTGSTGFENPNNQLKIWVKNGNVLFETDSNLRIEIYNSVGQRIVNKNSVEGLNIVSVSQKGVMLVKVGDKVAKVIL